MQSKYKDNKESFKNEMMDKGENTMNKAKDIYEETKHKGKNMAHDLENKAYELGGKAKDAYHHMEDMVECGTRELKSQMQDRPFITIGAAFLIGMLLGKLSK